MTPSSRYSPPGRHATNHPSRHPEVKDFPHIVVDPDFGSVALATIRKESLKKARVAAQNKKQSKLQKTIGDLAPIKSG